MRKHAKKVERPLAPSSEVSTAPSSGGPRAFHLPEVRARLGIGPTKLAELIKTGELESFTIGRFRYVTADALQRFLDFQVQKSKQDAQKRATVAQRANRRSLATAHAAA